MVFEGQKPISLWEMIVILADDGPEIMTNLVCEWVGFSAPAVTEEIKARVVASISKTEAFCERMHLYKTKAQIAPFREMISGSCTVEAIVGQFDTLYYALQNELAERKLVLIPPDSVKYLEAEKLVGLVVFLAFDQIHNEIADAGNCLAVGLWTASVYHLMRVAEIGLRKLAKQLRIKLRCAIEFATWGEAIGAIDRKLDALRNKPRTKAREAELQHYSALLLDIKAFQYLWRNPGAHAGDRYNEKQAESAFEHVCSFMQKVAERVKVRG